MVPTWQRQLPTCAGGDGQRMLPPKAGSWSGEILGSRDGSAVRSPLAEGCVS